MAAQQIYHRAGGLVLLLADVFLRPTQKPGEDIDPQLPTRPAVKLFMGWPRLERVAQLLALLAFAWLLLLHLLMVVTEAPMEMRDGAMLATTAALLDGRNPYAIDGLMQTGNVYGIGYNLAVLPFAWLLGPGFLAHRLVSALAIFGACLLLYRWLRAASVGRLDALLGTGLAYAGFIYYTGGVARPDGLGLLLMLAAIETLRRDDCKARGFAACLGLSLLGLACKLYYVWPAFAAAAYVFLWRGRRRGLVYGAAAIAATAAALLLMQALLPGYGPLVLVGNLRDTDYAPFYLLQQSRDWLVFELPLIAGFALALLAARPALRAAGLFGGFSLLGAAVLLLLLGGHTGAHLSYYFQLLTPSFTVVALSLAARHRLAMTIFRLTLPIAVLANAHWFPLDPLRIARAGESYSAITRSIAGEGAVLATLEFTGALIAGHRPVADTGHSVYLGNAIRPTPVPLQRVLPPLSEITAEWDRENATIRDGIAAQHYDVALIGATDSLFPMDLLAADYEKAGSVLIDMAWAQQRWPVTIWRPRRPPSGVSATASQRPR
jgi:hypothetical protein